MERGQSMARLCERIRPLDSLSVLDLGCQLGGISWAFSQTARVTAIDVVYDWKRRVAWESILQRGDAEHLYFAQADGLALPFADGVFDMVLINGVLEWVGSAETPQDPRDLQKQFLREVRRVLKVDGLFYLAVENRLFPGYVLRDPHSRIPLVGILPRRMANSIAKRFYLKPYRTFIYSYWGLERLVRESGFTSFRCFTPIYTYWYPCALCSVSDRKGILHALDSLDLSGFSDRYRREALVTSTQRLFVKLTAFLGLTKALCNAFVVVGRKS